MNQKGLPLRSFLAEGGQSQVLILAGVVLVLALVGGIFYLGRISAPKPQNVATSSPQPSPAPDETVYTESDRSANWKTYMNSYLQPFSFKYLSSWRLTTAFPTEAHMSIIIENKSLPENEINPYKEGRAYIDVGVNTGNSFCGLQCKNITEEEFFDYTKDWPWLKKGDVGGGGPGRTNEAVNEAVIGGKKALFVKSHPTSDYEFSRKSDTSYTYYLLFEKPESVVLRISLRLNENNPDKEKIIQTFNQILSTFRFD